MIVAIMNFFILRILCCIQMEEFTKGSAEILVELVAKEQIGKVGAVVHKLNDIYE